MSLERCAISALSRKINKPYHCHSLIDIYSDIDIHTDNVIAYFRFYAGCVIVYVLMLCNATASDNYDK